MILNAVSSQLARYGDQMTVSAGAFINRHIVFPKHLSTLLFAISTVGDRSIVRRPIGPTAHWSDGPLVRRPIGPTAHQFYAIE